ncbi:MAG: hypothetical protein GIKADHBN_01774 [Phycisphaerales bacterium]|nr:hypothetical protein [Phycisphaerales bacterium]
MTPISRRRAVGLSVQTGLVAIVGHSAAASRGQPVATPPPTAPATPAAAPVYSTGSAVPWDGFPRQNLDWVREVVGASHGNEAKVRELVTDHPALANAVWDWGFGDWETALGAAAHTGRRSIAEFLISKGARVDLFAAAMLGYLDVIKGLVEASPGIQKTRGPHGIHLLAHAKAGGDQAAKVVEYLESVGGAGDPIPTQPITPEERGKYTGQYAYGPGPTDRFNVLVEKDALWIERPGHTKRGLNHVGNDEFFPAGSAAVRIRFDLASAVRTLTVVDGSMSIAAKAL